MTTLEHVLNFCGILALVFVLFLGVIHLTQWNEPYSHPCAEDEYVRNDGECVHIDSLRNP